MIVRSEVDLIEALRTGSPRARVRAAQELALAGGRTALPALQEALESKDLRLRLAAGFALWRIDRSQQGLNAVLEAFSSPSPDAREAAVYALGAMGKEILPILDELLARDPHCIDLLRLREEIRAQSATSAAAP